LEIIHWDPFLADADAGFRLIAGCHAQARENEIERATGGYGEQRAEKQRGDDVFPSIAQFTWPAPAAMPDPSSAPVRP
jgi:hypothetical protein